MKTKEIINVYKPFGVSDQALINLANKPTMKLLITLIPFLSFGYMQAQNNLPTPDIIDTGYGDLTVQPIQHGSLVLTFNDKTGLNRQKGVLKSL